MGAGNLAALLESAAKSFSVSPDAEITCEVNPGSVDAAFFRELRLAGFNRISMGLQSANRDELRLLGRRHTPEDAARAVEAARQAGFGNLSLDLMLALPDSTEESLGRSIRFAASLEPEHISAYLLKVEPGTPFAAQDIALPGDGASAEQYLFAVEELGRHGYAQYEISNFAKPGFESRHNLIYWRRGEYLGVGPAAHSLYQGRRFFWSRDLAGYLSGAGPVPEGPGDGTVGPEDALEEFAMLNLRLARGLRLADCRERFGGPGERLFRDIAANAARCPKELFISTEDAVAFTAQGFLVSNALLARLLEGRA